ncbi:MAG: hypothetical protein AAF628_35235 [Planctomycetota bacterium]
MRSAQLSTATAVALALALTPALPRAQDPPPPVDLDAPLAAITAALKDRSGSLDEEARATLAQLGADFSERPAAEQKKVVRAVRDVLLRGRLRTPELHSIYVAAAEALGVMGKGGAKALELTYTRKRFPSKPQWLPVRTALVRAAGRTRELGVVKFLCDCASRAVEDEVMLAAGETLAHYAQAPQAVRKDIAKCLILRMSGLEGQSVTGTPKDPVNLGADMALRTLAVIRTPWNGTLAKITGASFETGNDWQRWWNDHKRSSWPAMPGN